MELLVHPRKLGKLTAGTPQKIVVWVDVSPFPVGCIFTFQPLVFWGGNTICRNRTGSISQKDGYVQDLKETSRISGDQWNVIWVHPPPRMPVTTRIIIFLVGDTYIYICIDLHLPLLLNG